MLVLGIVYLTLSNKAYRLTIDQGTDGLLSYSLSPNGLAYIVNRQFRENKLECLSRQAFTTWSNTDQSGGTFHVLPAMIS
jgi:hypothetical protein